MSHRWPSSVLGATSRGSGSLPFRALQAPSSSQCCRLGCRSSVISGQHQVPFGRPVGEGMYTDPASTPTPAARQCGSPVMPRPVPIMSCPRAVPTPTPPPTHIVLWARPPGRTGRAGVWGLPSGRGSREEGAGADFSRAWVWAQCSVRRVSADIYSGAVLAGRGLGTFPLARTLRSRGADSSLLSAHRSPDKRGRGLGCPECPRRGHALLPPRTHPTAARHPASAARRQPASSSAF